jgi:hypothetical protein
MKRIVSLTILLACVACGQSEQTDQTAPSTDNMKVDDAAKTAGDAMKTAGDAAKTATETKTVTLNISGMT